MCVGSSPARAEEPLAGLEEYVRSISQLAQPCSLSGALPCPCQGSQAKPYRFQRARGKAPRSGVAPLGPEKEQGNAPSLQDITAQFNGQHSPPELTAGADPLAWLFGLSAVKEPSPGLRRRVCPAPRCSPTATDAGGSEVAPQSAPGNPGATAGHSGAAHKPSGPAPPLERRCRWQRSRRRPALPGCAARGRPGRAQSARLPVIYEL